MDATSSPPVQTPMPSAQTPTPPAQPPVMPSTQPPPMPPAQVKSSPNMMLVIFLVVIIIAVVLGGVYYITMSAPQPTTEITSPQAPVAMQEKTADSGLEGELNAIEIESNDSSFADVDKDLQSL